MTDSTAVPQKDMYSGAIFGGYSTGGIGAVGLIVVAVVGLVTDRVVPGGVTALALGALVVGAIIAATGKALRKLDELIAHQQGATLDVQDLVAIRGKVDEIARRPPLDEQTRASLLTSMYEHIVRAVRDAKASGYVEGVKRRMTGGGGHLRALPPPEDV